MQKLTSMIKDLGLEVGVPQMIHNKSEAKQYLNQINTAIYNKASQIVKENPDKLNITDDLYNSISVTRDAVDNSLAVTQDIYAFWDEAANTMTSSGIFHLSPSNIIGYTSNDNAYL